MFLYSYGYYGGAIGNMLAKWEQAGIFSYALPFLLIFALVFGIISKTNLFKEKSINAIIALVVGLMALQFDFVPRFFAEIFPRVGVGLAILLAVLIFIGLFTPKQTWIVYTLFGIGALILIVILVSTAGSVGWYQGYWWHENWLMVATVVVLLVFVATIVGAASPTPSTFDQIASPLLKAMHKE